MGTPHIGDGLPARGPGDETRARMLDAALASLREDGLRGVSARVIARRGGFSQALIFYHFGSVRELLIAALDELGAQGRQRYMQPLEEVSSLPELVRVVGEMHAENMSERHVTVVAQMLAMVANDPGVREPLREWTAPWLRIVERTLERALRGTLDADVAAIHDLALATTSLLIGLELMVGLEDQPGRARQRVFESLERLMGLGLGSR